MRRLSPGLRPPPLRPLPRSETPMTWRTAVIVPFFAGVLGGIGGEIQPLTLILAFVFLVVSNLSGYVKGVEDGAQSVTDRPE